MKSAHRTILLVVAAALSACSKEEAPSVGSGAAAIETPAAPSVAEDVDGLPEDSAAVPAPIDATSPVGSWTLDANASLDFNVAALMARAPSITPEQEKSLRNGVAMVVALLQMDIVLAADNTLTGTTRAPSIAGGEAAPAPLTGTWSLDGDVLNVATREVGAVEVETLTGRLDGAQLVLRMEQGDTPLTLIFVRKV